MKRILVFASLSLLSLLDLLSTGDLGTAHAQETPQTVKPMIEKAQDEKTSKSPKMFTNTTYDWIVYNFISCSVNWNEECDGKYTIQAPDGWQVCKPLFSIPNPPTNYGHFEYGPRDWYVNDPESPDRFRSIFFHIWASGSHVPWDQTGSDIKVVNVGLRLLSADANNKVRVENGCDLPQRDY